MKLKCSKCGKTRFLDETDDDEIHNACIEGWDFALSLDTKVMCPECNDNQNLNETFIEEFKS